MNTQKLLGVEAQNKGRAQVVIQASLQLFLHRAPRSAMPLSGCVRPAGQGEEGRTPSPQAAGLINQRLGTSWANSSPFLDSVR